MIPYFEGRVGYGWDQLGTRTSDVDYKSLLQFRTEAPYRLFPHVLRRHRPVWRIVSHPNAGLDFFGVDHCCFSPPTPPFEPSPGLYIRETIRCIEALDITADDKDKIYRRNALRLLNMESKTQKSAP